MKKTSVFAVLFLVTCFLSCKKNNTGGEATIVAFPQFTGKDVFGATAYVKFGTTSMPSDPVGGANLKVEGEPNEEHVHIENLRYGKYFVYMIGYDSASHQTVRGGMGIEIRWSERKKEKDVDIRVTP